MAFMSDAASTGVAGPHPGPKRLIAYREGRLSAAEREALQEHLSLCPHCTGQLRELTAFAAAAAGAVEAGPEALKREAWDALSRRLPRSAPKVRPIVRVPARRPRVGYVQAIAAGLLLAALGLAAWSMLRARDEGRQAAEVALRLREREAALAEAERQLRSARGRIESLESRPGEAALEARIAELSAALEELRRQLRQAGDRDRIAAAGRQIDLAATPRFALRGQEPEDGFLRGGGAANFVPPAERILLAVATTDPPAFPEYRFELLGPKGEVLWSGHRPGSAVLGDAGTTVTLSGLGPGRYRLRVEGISAERTELVGDYLLDVREESSRRD